jgi:endonuclease III
MASTSKAQLLTDVHTLLKRRYKLEPRPERMNVLEAVVYGICHEGTTREQANQALSRFKDEFFDWNEVRVSSLREIQGVLAGLPDTEDRARRVRRFLQQLFSRTYGFSLDALAKKPLKDAIKALQEFEALQNDYVLATVIQLALGGHAIPVDAPIRRGLERLGVADEAADNATLRAALERAVPKNRGSEFVDLMEELTHDTCVEGDPDCPRCELKKICPTGQARLAAESAAAKAAARQVKAASKVKAKGEEKEKAPARPAKQAAARPAPAAKPKASSRDGEPGRAAAARPKAAKGKPKKK